MLVVPGVAVGNGGALCYAVDLVAVVPPRHHSTVFRSSVSQPPVRFSVVVHDDRAAVSQLGLKHDGGLAHSNRHALAVLPEDDSLKEKKEN